MDKQRIARELVDIAKSITATKSITADEGIDYIVSKMKKDSQLKGWAEKFRKEVRKTKNLRDALENVLPDFISGGKITELLK